MNRVKLTPAIIVLSFVLLAACRSPDISPTIVEFTPEPQASIDLESGENDLQPDDSEVEGGVSQPEEVADKETLVASFSSVQSAPVIPHGTEGQWDSDVILFPYVLQHEGQYHIFYEATAGRDPVIGKRIVAIGYASSEDGINWSKFDLNPILEGDGSGFDAQVVGRPVVSVEDDGTVSVG